MVSIRTGIYLILIFLLAGIFAFFIEDYYRSLTRLLYILFTDGAISFVGKGFSFPDIYFSFAFGLFSAIKGITITKYNTSKRVKSIIESVLVFSCITALLCFFNSHASLVTCTACKDGKLSLLYNEIDYASIFIISLLFTAIPMLVKFIRNRMKDNKETSSGQTHALERKVCSKDLLI